MQKERYEATELEVIRFNTGDVITTTGDDDLPPMPDEG